MHPSICIPPETIDPSVKSGRSMWRSPSATYSRASSSQASSSYTKPQTARLYPKFEENLMDTTTYSSHGLEQNSLGLTNTNRSDPQRGFRTTPGYGLAALLSASNDLAPAQTGTAGDDWLKGDRTQSTLYGLDGNDLMWGGSRQANVLFGNNGRDQIRGGRNDDVLNGGADRDQLIGDRGHDLLVGGSGRDRLLGGQGNDTLKGESGTDWLDGGTGNDSLDGGAGIDYVDGSDGNDRLIDYDGGDRLTGGHGADQFGVGNPLATAASIITDFKVGTDQIKILRLGATFDDLTFNSRNGNTEILDQSRVIATLLGVKATSLKSNSFVFGDTQLAGTLQANLDQFLQANPETTGLSSTVVAPDGTLWTGFAGDTNRESQTPIDANSLFSVGSVTKPMVSTTILQLQDEGTLSLDDTLSQWVPDLSSQIPNSDRITIRQLLNHTSGIRDYLTAPAFLQGLINNPARVNQSFTSEELLSYIADQPALFEPGQGYSYCNSGYILLGEIIAAATGSSVASQLHQRIFDPLGMSQTFYAPQEQVQGNWTQGYIDIEGNGQLLPLKESLSWASSAGGVVSTTADLAKFSQALFGGELLAPATLQAMINGNVATDGEGLSYGSGIGIDNIFPELGEIWGHSGATFVSQGELYYLPQQQITATIAATNPFENSATGLVFEQIKDTAQEYSE